MRLSSGGHPFPMLRHASGAIETVPLGGSLLGVFTDAEVKVIATRLEAGDTLDMAAVVLRVPPRA